jgi:cytochrome c-type biogenesis protein CcmF
VVAAVLASGLVFGLYTHGHVLTPVGATLGIWILISSLIDPLDRWRRGLSVSRAILGMTIAHMGLGIAVIALTTVQSFTVERDLALSPGEVARVGGYELRFAGVKHIEGPNFDGVGGTFEVTRGGARVAVLVPQKRQFWVQHQVTSETAITLNRGNNLLVALGDDLGAGRWSVRVQIRPLVSLVWLAALIMAIGGIVAASDRRYRSAKVTSTVASDTVPGRA